MLELGGKIVLVVGDRLVHQSYAGMLVNLLLNLFFPCLCYFSLNYRIFSLSLDSPMDA